MGSSDRGGFVNDVLAEVTGIPGLTMGDLDGKTGADVMLYTLAIQFAWKLTEVRKHAAAIAADMAKVATASHFEPLTSSSSSRSYDAAVVALNTLREPLSMAAHLYKEAHGLATAA